MSKDKRWLQQVEGLQSKEEKSASCPNVLIQNGNYLYEF